MSELTHGIFDTRPISEPVSDHGAATPLTPELYMDLFNRHQELKAHLVASEVKMKELEASKEALYSTLVDERKSIATLTKAVEVARYELAALFGNPKEPTLDDAKRICEAENEADALCILNAYEALRGEIGD